MDAFSARDRELFESGRHDSLYRVLGAHPGEGGTWFRVWAPHARSVHVIGECNAWDPERDPLAPEAGGLWSGLIASASPGQMYKYRLVGADGGVLDKADPCAAATEVHPGTASVVTNLSYQWGDAAWLQARPQQTTTRAPMSIYELHIGSWRVPASYRSITAPLIEHVTRLGFTHVELLPITEHPFDGSWGYQTTGYFAPTSRFGRPQDLMYLVDQLHQAGIGVILDWAVAHFADDPHGLGSFDGAPLYEHTDGMRARHPEWGSLVFNFDRPEVRSFLVSSACSWLDRYHLDGIRVDDVTSMLYRDYSAEHGSWVLRSEGGRAYPAATRLLCDLSEAVHARFPGVQMHAEEATAWPLVTHPVSEGGLGFDRKWDAGWVHDTLTYLRRDPAERPAHHRELTFRSVYAASERFVLPLSHDDVSRGKRALLEQFPGTEAERLATLRLLLGFQFATPGAKLVFMGTELAATSEWRHDSALDWSLVDEPFHEGVARWLAALNSCYRTRPALQEDGDGAAGLEWVSADDAARSVLAFERRGKHESVLVVANFSDAAHPGYRVGVATPGRWRTLLDSDASEYGGRGLRVDHVFAADPLPSHGRPYSLELPLPPLTIQFLSIEPQ